MNPQIIALTCSLVVAACSSSGTRPSHDPSSGNADSVATRIGNADAVATQSSNATTTAQPVAAATDATVQPAATGDRKPIGASQYDAPKSATPTVETNPGIADETANATNTKTNARDRHNSLTPMDQGNSAAETRITSDIRKGILGDKTLSFTGKNVKIITVGTKVTLRGPVKNGAERSVIANIAKRTAGVSDVDNQLEIVN